MANPPVTAKPKLVAVTPMKAPAKGKPKAKKSQPQKDGLAKYAKSLRFAG